MSVYETAFSAILSSPSTLFWSTLLHNTVYGRGFQPGVRVPLGVRGIFSGGTRTSLPNLHHFVGKGRSGLHVVSRTNR